MTDSLNDYEYVNHRHIIITHIIINAYDVITHRLHTVSILKYQIEKRDLLRTVVRRLIFILFDDILQRAFKNFDLKRKRHAE